VLRPRRPGSVENKFGTLWFAVDPINFPASNQRQIWRSPRRSDRGARLVGGHRLEDAVDPEGPEAREIGGALAGPLRRLRETAEIAEGDPLSPGIVEELAVSATAFLTELDRVTCELRRSMRVT
jgi:hypothetical protein